MDAQTRHNLKHNELAEALGKLRTFSDPRLKLGLIVIAAAAVLYIGFRWWSSARAASLAEAWQTISRFDPSGADSTSPSLDALREIARANGDNALAAAARLRVATALIVQSRQPTPERDKLLRDALETIKPTTLLTGVNSGFAAAALFMQATILETLREFDAARASYKTLVEDPRFTNSPYRPLAETQSANLGDLATPTLFVPGAKPPPPPPIEAAMPPRAPISMPEMTPQPVPPPAATPPPATPPPATQPASTP